MKQILGFFLLAIFLLSGCALFESDEPQTMNNEEHLIIMALIDSLMKTDSVKIYDQTTPMINTGEIRLAMNHDSILRLPSLLSNYEAVNQKIYFFDREKLPAKVTLKSIDSDQMYASCWRFSCPGISSGGQSAIVEFSIMSAPLCGSGNVALLKKNDGFWKLVWYQMLWIS